MKAPSLGCLTIRPSREVTKDTIKYPRDLLDAHTLGDRQEKHQFQDENYERNRDILDLVQHPDIQDYHDNN